MMKHVHLGHPCARAREESAGLPVPGYARRRGRTRTMPPSSSARLLPSAAPNARAVDQAAHRAETLEITDQIIPAAVAARRIPPPAITAHHTRCSGANAQHGLARRAPLAPTLHFPPTRALAVLHILPDPSLRHVHIPLFASADQ